ncbi:hypothetical protein Tco_0383399 [Tanacetum coccineum]
MRSEKLYDAGNTLDSPTYLRNVTNDDLLFSLNMDEHMVQAASISGKSMSSVGVESSKQFVLAKGIQPNLSTVGHEAADGFIGNQVEGLLHTSYVYDSSINARDFGVNTTGGLRRGNMRCNVTNVTYGGDNSMESPIVQSVDINYIKIVPNSYVDETRVTNLEPNKPKANYHSLPAENLCSGVGFYIPRKVVEMMSTRFDNTLYVYLIGKRVALPVVEYYARNNWGNFGLTRIMMNAKDTLTMGIPLYEDSGFSIEKRLALNMNGNHLVRKKVKSRSTNGGLFGGQLVKQNVRYEPKAASNVPKIGASNVGNASKSGLSHVSFMSKNHPLKAIVPPASPRRSPNADEGVNIIVSNSYVALNDESEEEVENVYD